MANEINVEITFDPQTGELKSDLKNVEALAASSGKKAGSSFEKGFGSSVKEGFSRISGTFVALAAAGAAALGGKAAIEAASRQQEAINQLNQSLKSAGTFSEEASRSIQQFASDLQATTTIGDETTLELVALARNFARTNDEATKLTKAAVELSAATGLSLESSLKNLGKTFSGLTGELGESLPGIRNLSKEALQSGEALDFVLQRFGGSAAAQVNTFSGAIDQASNLFGDLLETIGQLIIESPAVVNTIKFVSNEIQNAISSIQEFGQSGDQAGSLIQTFISVGQSIVQFVIAPLELLGNAVSTVFAGIKLTLQTFVAIAGQVLGGFADLIAKIPGQSGNAIVTALQTFRASSAEVLADTAMNAQESLGSIFDFDISASAEEFILRYQDAVSRVEAENTKLQASSARTAESLGGTVKKVTVDVGRQLSSGLAGGLSRAVQQVAGNLAQGKSLFEDFGKVVLGIIGDLAIQIGQTTIASGIAISALGSLSPGAAIAAGAALVAIGTLIKSISGGSGGLGAGAGGGSGAAAGGADTAQPVTSGVEATGPDEVEQVDSTVVSVNIQGDVLDSSETGIRVVEIINEAFDKQGVTIKQGTA